MCLPLHAGMSLTPLGRSHCQWRATRLKLTSHVASVTASSACSTSPLPASCRSTISTRPVSARYSACHPAGQHLLTALEECLLVDACRDCAELRCTAIVRDLLRHIWAGGSRTLVSAEPAAHWALRFHSQMYCHSLSTSGWLLTASKRWCSRAHSACRGRVPSVQASLCGVYSLSLPSAEQSSARLTRSTS